MERKRFDFLILYSHVQLGISPRKIVFVNICLKICPFDIMVFSNFPKIVFETEQAAKARSRPDKQHS